jgi:hypothetical protein
MNPSDPLFHKPESIIAVRNILNATIFSGFLILILIWATGSFDMYVKRYILTTGLLMLIILFIITKLIGTAKKPARVGFIIYITFEALLLFFSFSYWKDLNLLIDVLLITELLLHIIALGFLFKLKSTIWFNAVNEHYTIH